MNPAVADADAEGCVNVYVANLPQTVDARTIRSMFGGAGKVLHVKLLLDIATGTSRGIAFVMYDSMVSARKACATMNRTLCDGNVLQVRLAERSAQHQSPESHARSNVVYVRNVPATVTSEQMKAYCCGRFGAVVDVTPHPQSAELGGPSPFNMLFVTFENVDQACIATEELDGKAPFPIPQGHPFTMAKMVSDVAGEMRKSILLRRRSSDGSASGSPQQSMSPSSIAMQPLPAMNVVPYSNVQPLTADAIRALQQGQTASALDAQRRLSQSSVDSFHGVQPQMQQLYVAAQQQRRSSTASSSGNSVDGRSTLEAATQLPPTAFIPVVYSNPSELPHVMHQLAMGPGQALPQVVILQQPVVFQQPGAFTSTEMQQPQFFYPQAHR